MIAPEVEDGRGDLPGTANVTLRINGKEYTLRNLDTRATLLDTLRERIHLSGTKRAAITVNAALARSTSTAAA